MSESSVLIIEDEENILELISYNLGKAGYFVDGASSAEEGLKKLQQQRPDIVLVDIMLPGMSGLDLCKLLKADPVMQQIAIIIVSARGEESDIVKGLELGADDYVTKPFSPKILLARIKSVLRRRGAQLVDEQTRLTIGVLSIDPVRFEVRVGEESVSLTVTEFRILHFLARHPGWVFTRYQIVDNVKGEDYAVTDRAVDVQIVGLRRKLGQAAGYIETVRGVGYRFKE